MAATEVLLVMVALGHETHGAIRDMFAGSSAAVVTVMTAAAVLAVAIGGAVIFLPTVRWYAAEEEPTAAQRAAPSRFHGARPCCWPPSGSPAPFRCCWPTATPPPPVGLMIVPPLFFGATAAILTALLLTVPPPTDHRRGPARRRHPRHRTVGDDPAAERVGADQRTTKRGRRRTHPGQANGWLIDRSASSNCRSCC